MNWEAIGAVGEIVGAIAVVASVIYLAAQIRAGSRAVSTNLRDSIFASVGEWNHSLMADPELTSLFHRGLEDFSALDEIDRLRFMHTAFSLFKVFENIYLHYLEGSIGEEAWQQHRAIIHAYYTTPGAQHYLAERKAAFDHRFLNTLADSRQSALRPPSEVSKVELTDDQSTT